MLTRTTFDPADYGSLTGKENSLRPKNLEIVRKGKHKALKFDQHEIDGIIANMRKHSSYRIRDLNGNLKKQFDTIVKLVDLLYDTDGYQNLYNLVKKHFGDVDNVKPDTLCAYFAGCLISSDHGNADTCGVLCAGSLPLPKSLAKGKCGETVILCSYNDHYHRYSFKVLSVGNDKSEAIIYMDSGKRESFKGFTKKEKDKIRGMGVKKVSINWVDGKKDIKIGPKVNLDMIQEADRNDGDVDNTDDDNNSNAALWAILFIFIIIVVIFVLASN